MSSNPEYVSSRRSYMKRIATRCRICGGQLLDPAESKKEMHTNCEKMHKRKTYGMR